MDAASGIDQIKKACHNIAQELMRIHPATAPLEDKPTQDEIYKALFELTKQLETIKKLTRKLELKRAHDPQAGDLPPEL